jgi:hypothetical protein
VGDDFIQNIMWKSTRRQSVVLSGFDHVFMVVYHGLEFLFDCVGYFGGKLDI